MKMFWKKIAPACVFVLLLATPAMAQNRIGTVDLRKLFDNYWKRQRADAALKDRRGDMEKELRNYGADYKRMQDEYNKSLAGASDQSVTPAERDKRKTAAESKLLEIKTLDNTIRTFEESSHDKLESEIKRMRDAILEDIRAAVNAKAKTANYSLVIDIAAESINQTPVVLYSSGENDLTDSILTQLNAGAPPSTGTDSTSSTNKLDLKPVDKK